MLLLLNKFDSYFQIFVKYRQDFVNLSILAVMKQIFKAVKKKTSNGLKRAFNAYSRGFMKLYGPAIEAGVNPFM